MKIFTVECVESTNQQSWTGNGEFAHYTFKIIKSSDDYFLLPHNLNKLELYSPEGSIFLVGKKYKVSIEVL